MAYPEFSNIVAAVNALSMTGRTTELWPVLSILRYRRLNSISFPLEINSFDLTAAVFDHTGIRIPFRIGSSGSVAHDSSVFCDPNTASPIQFRNSESPRNTYTMRLQSLVNRGERQPEIFRKGNQSLPLTLDLEPNWIDSLRSGTAIRNVLDTNVQHFITWLFRFGIPKVDGQSHSIATLQGDHLSESDRLDLQPLPTSHTELAAELADFWGLTVTELHRLLPMLNEFDGSSLRGTTPLARDTLGTLLFETFGASNPGVEADPQDTELDAGELDWDSFSREAITTCPLRGVSVPLTSALAALRAGKFVVFLGVPGTGKSALCNHITDCATRQGIPGTVFATATAEWSTYDTMGGYTPDPKGSSALVYQPGVIAESIESGRWLFVDELNRADFDKAFGELFTLFAGGKVSLAVRDREGKQISFVPPGYSGQIVDSECVIHQREDWRLLATMNSADKASLFQLSYAFMRRFAFIEIPVPETSEFARLLVEKYPEEDEALLQGLAELMAGQEGLRKVHDSLRIGPAIAIDLLAHYGEQLKMRALFTGSGIDEESSKVNMLVASICAYLLPQFEGRDREHDPIVDAIVHCLHLEASKEEISSSLRLWTNAR